MVSPSKANCSSCPCLLRSGFERLEVAEHPQPLDRVGVDLLRRRGVECRRFKPPTRLHVR